MGSAASYTVRETDPVAEADTILALWTGSLSQPGTLKAKHGWYYCNHPVSVPIVLMLCHGVAQTPVGVASIGLRRLHWQDRVLLAGIRVDLAVMAAHRTLFPAMQLQRAVSREGLARCDLLYGLPNASAEKVVRRMGVQQEVLLVRYVRVLRWRSYLQGVLPPVLAGVAGAVLQWGQQAGLRVGRQWARWRHPDWQTEWLDQPDDRFDALWERARVPQWLMGERPGRFLTWRFSSQPACAYRYFVMRQRSNGELLAYAVCSLNGKTLFVSDILVARQDAHAAVHLLHQLAVAAYRMGAASISLDMAAPDAWVQILQRAGFIARDKRPLFIDWAPQWVGSEAAQAPSYYTCADEDQ